MEKEKSTKKYQSFSKAEILTKIEAMTSIIAQAKKESSDSYKHYNSLRKEREALLDCI